MIVREDLLRSHPDRVRRLVSSAVRSGLWAQTHLEEAVELSAAHWGQSVDLVRFTFNNPPNRFRFDRPVPSAHELMMVADEMARAGLVGENVDVAAAFDDRFAVEALAEGSPSVPDLPAVCRQER
jgi:ABC-type nitrate/sulfonate/bicarbonate transport system substrate-binding protein